MLKILQSGWFSDLSSSACSGVWKDLHNPETCALSRLSLFIIEKPVKPAMHSLQHWLTWILIALFSETYGSHTFDICWMCLMSYLVRRWKCSHLTYTPDPWTDQSPTVSYTVLFCLYNGCKPFTVNQWFLYPVHFSIASCSSVRLMVAFLISCIVIAYCVLQTFYSQTFRPELMITAKVALPEMTYSMMVWTSVLPTSLLTLI